MVEDDTSVRAELFAFVALNQSLLNPGESRLLCVVTGQGCDDSMLLVALFSILGIRSNRVHWLLSRAYFPRTCR